MSSSNRSVSTTTLVIAGATVLAGVAGYAAYFDYKRRNDAEFRKQLRKDKKKADKVKAKAPAADSGSSPLTITENELRAALDKIRNEEVPAGADDRHQYFLSQLSMGEQLCQQGPMFSLPAAMCFYRALRVFPNPVELYTMYEQSIPPPIFKMVLEMTNLDVKDKIEGYYNYFPSKSMNVTIKVVDHTEPDGTKSKRKIMVVNKDISAGELIYKEQPIAAVLDPDLQGAGTHCSHCLRLIAPDDVIPGVDDPLSSSYCSKTCELTAYTHYYRLLFSQDPALGPELTDATPEVTPETEEARRKGQVAYVQFLKEVGEFTVPHLIARVLARQFSLEALKLLPSGTSGAESGGNSGMPPLDAPKSIEYNLWDHVERLRFLDQSVTDEEHDVTVNLFRAALPGLEEFLTDERHANIKGKLLFNMIGIAFPSSEGEVLGGRSDKPASKLRPEDQERTRTPFGTSRQVGSGFYLVSCYMGHSCAPSARPSFDGTSELSLYANRDLKAGDEITMAYVDVSQRPDEDILEARKRRRWEIARGWRFGCVCDRCMEDGRQAAAAAAEQEAETAQQEEPEVKDESREEAVVTKIEGELGA